MRRDSEAIRETGRRGKTEGVPDGQDGQLFLLALSDAIRPLARAFDIEETACRLLARELGVDRAYYAEIDAQAGVGHIGKDFVRGAAPSLAGWHSLARFGPTIATLERGECLLIPDTQDGVQLSVEERQAYAALQIGACMGVPLCKDGRLVGALCVTNLQATGWGTAQLDLLRDVAERIWAAIERGRAESALRESEAKYRTLFESIDEGYCLIELQLDAAGEVVDWLYVEANPKFERHTGLQVRGRKASELFGAIDPAWLDFYAGVARTGEGQRREDHFAALDRWYAVFCTRAGGPGSRRLAVVFDDITERKRAELQAAVISDISRELVGLESITATLDLVGQRIGHRLGAAWCVFVERSESLDEPVIVQGWNAPGVAPLRGGCHLYAMLKPEQLARTDAGEPTVVVDVRSDPRVNDDSCTSLGLGSFVIVPICREQGWRFLLGVGHDQPRTWRSDELALLLEVAERTWARLERARAEAAVRASQAQLVRELGDARLLQSVSSLLIENEDAKELFDRALAAAITLVHADFGSLQMLDERRGSLELLSWRGLHPEAAAHWQTLPCNRGTSCSNALKRGERVMVSDVHADPEADPADLHYYALCGIHAVQSTPLATREGRVIGIVSTHWREHRAPTERELALLDVLARQLADVIERRRAREALQEASRQKDQFLAMLAHELRNPLAPILTATELLKLLVPEGGKEAAACAVIARQSQHLTRLVDDLLDMSRVTQGKIRLKLEPVDLATAIHRAVESVRPMVAARGQHLDLALPSETLQVRGDLTRLTQMAGNLLTNAAKFTPQGGHIRLALTREGPEAVLRVIDDGVGIPADLLPHVFDLFRQGDSSLDRSQGGLGIGLTLVRRLAELHGGRVEAHSKGTGQGSEFILRLPALPAASAAADPGAPERPAAPAPGQAVPRRLLIVEDNTDAADMMASVLAHEGLDVRVTHDGAAALEVARAFRPQVVLCDIGLPQMDGYEVARRLRGGPGAEGMTLVALTGYGQEEDRRRAREAGFAHHLIKPVAMDRLRSLVDALV